MRGAAPGVLVILLAVGPIGCTDQGAGVAGPTPRQFDDDMGWYRSATYELDSDSGRWKLVESEDGVGWSSDEFHERLEDLRGDLDDDR